MGNPTVGESAYVNNILRGRHVNIFFRLESSFKEFVQSWYAEIEVPSVRLMAASAPPSNLNLDGLSIPPNEESDRIHPNYVYRTTFNFLKSHGK